MLTRIFWTVMWLLATGYFVATMFGWVAPQKIVALSAFAALVFLYGDQMVNAFKPKH